MQRFDDRRCRGRCLQRFAQPRQTPVQGGLADKGIGPALGEQFGFGYHPVTMFQQVEKHLQDFWL
jgi:hypothetical protein